MPAWFKLHHELLRDKKLRLIASELKMPPALVRGLWVDLLCFAQELDQDGYLRLDHEIPLTWELVCEELGTTDDDAMRFLIAAAKYNLVTTHDGTLFITSWEERQQKPSDSPEAWRERQQKKRTRDKEDASRVTHAGQPRDCHATEKKREEEKRNARTRATPVDNSTYPGSRTRYCPCGAELHPVGDGTAELHCPVCDPAEVTK